MEELLTAAETAQLLRCSFRFPRPRTGGGARLSLRAPWRPHQLSPVGQYAFVAANVRGDATGIVPGTNAARSRRRGMGEQPAGEQRRVIDCSRYHRRPTRGPQSALIAPETHRRTTLRAPRARWILAASRLRRQGSLEVFVARAEARALLYAAGELTLHEAVDQLQRAPSAMGSLRSWAGRNPTHHGRGPSPRVATSRDARTPPLRNKLRNEFSAMYVGRAAWPRGGQAHSRQPAIAARPANH